MADSYGPARAETAGVFSVGRRSLTYVAGAYAGKALAVLSAPILARALSPTELGLIDLASLIATVFGLAAVAGLDNAVAREVAGSNEGGVWSAAIFILVVSIAVLTIGGLLARESISATLLGSTSQNAVAAIAVIYGGCIAVYTMALNVLRLRSTAGAFAVASFVTLGVQMAAAVAIALLSPSPVEATLVAWALISFAAAIVIMSRALPHLQRASWRDVQVLVLFGLPLVPAALSWVGGDVAIRASLARHGLLDAIGELGIASRLVSIMTLAVAGVGLAWWPFVFRAKDEHIDALTSRAVLAAAFGLGSVAIVLSAFASEAVLIIGGSGYLGAAKVVPILSLGAMAFGLLTVLSGAAGSRRRTKLIAMVSLVGMTTQVVSAVLLVPGSGIAGAAMASSLGYALAFMLILWKMGAANTLLGGWASAGPPVAIATTGIALLWFLAALDAPLGARSVAAAGLIGALAVARRTARMAPRSDASV